MVELKGDIVRLSKHQIEHAGAMLTRAFFDDPKLIHLIPDIATKKELTVSFRILTPVRHELW